MTELSYRQVLCGLVLGVMAAAPAFAAEPVPTITVTGQGMASATPDQARIEIGVMTQAPQAEAASAENAARTDAVIKAIRAALPATDLQLQTSQYSVQPNYQYAENHPPKLTGYQVTNLVRVETGALAKVGNAIDLAMKAGANNVQSLQFRMKDEHALRAEALRKAVQTARAEADAIAAAADVHVVRVLSLQADHAAPPVMYAERAMAFKVAAAAPTPIEQGDVDVQASVTLTVEIGK